MNFIDSGMLFGLLLIFLLIFGGAFAAIFGELLAVILVSPLALYSKWANSKTRLSKLPLEERVHPVQNVNSHSGFSGNYFWDPVEDKLYKKKNGELVHQKTYKLSEMIEMTKGK